jgi:hypothetical protein
MGIMLALPGQWKKCRTRLWMWSELLQSSSMCFKDSLPSSVHRLVVGGRLHVRRADIRSPCGCAACAALDIN